MKIRIPLGIKGNGVVKSTSKFCQTYGNTSTFTHNTFSRFLNPKPHGRGRICPHPFQRPITQKVLSAKNRPKIPIPRKSSAESKSRVM